MSGIRFGWTCRSGGGRRCERRDGASATLPAVPAARAPSPATRLRGTRLARCPLALRAGLSTASPGLSAGEQDKGKAGRMGKETVDAHKKKRRLYSGVRPAPFLRQQRGHETNTIPRRRGHLNSRQSLLIKPSVDFITCFLKLQTPFKNDCI